MENEQKCKKHDIIMSDIGGTMHCPECDIDLVPAPPEQVEESEPAPTEDLE